MPVHRLDGSQMRAMLRSARAEYVKGEHANAFYRLLAVLDEIALRFTLVDVVQRENDRIEQAKEGG